MDMTSTNTTAATKIVKVKDAMKQYGDRAAELHYPAHYEVQDANGNAIARITYEDGATPKTYMSKGFWRMTWVLTDEEIVQSWKARKDAIIAAEKCYADHTETNSAIDATPKPIAGRLRVVYPTR